MRVKKRVESDVKKEFGDFKSSRILIETAKAAIGIGLFWLGLLVHKESTSGAGLSIILYLLGIYLFFKGLGYIGKKIVNLATPLWLGAPFILLFAFLIKSPRGPIAAAGFICLMVSFYLRYHYLKM